MFENLVLTTIGELWEQSNRSLQCLPYSRALLDGLEILGKTATPLVIRGVVFGKQEDPSIYEKVGFAFLVQTATNAPNADGWINVGVETDGQMQTLRFFYRTIGIPHKNAEGDTTLGNFDFEGKWLGHLGVLCESNLLDPSIGQLNDARYEVDFDPAGIVLPVSDDFVSGKRPLLAVVDGVLICFKAYPDEQTFEKSSSWSSPEFREELRAAGIRIAGHYKDKPYSALHRFS